MSDAVRVHAKAAGADALDAAVRLEPQAVPVLQPGQALVSVRASGVNPSDAKAILGLMPHAVWPRTPGRDYAGTVVDGPADWVGRTVWGSGGELGIRRDGAHAGLLVLDAAYLREVPAGLTAEEASTVGVPFVTAYEGLREAGPVRPGDVVAVLGASGKVGQAAIQLATAAGARVFGVNRTAQPHRGHAAGPVTMLAGDTDWAAALREATGGHGADIVYNTVGSPYFTAGCQAMAVGGRQVFIATLDRAVPFDIFAFYRGRHRFIGIDTLALDSADGAAVLDALHPGFAAGTLRPFPVLPSSTFALDRAVDAYRAVLAGAVERVVLTPGG